MLTHISSIQNPNEPLTRPYNNLLCETIVVRDIGSQETCHFILELLLCECSHRSMVLNVELKVFKQVQVDAYSGYYDIFFIDAYKKR